MNNIMKQIKRDFKKAINSELASNITITYDIENEEDIWGRRGINAGNIVTKALVEIVDNLNIEKYRFADVEVGKCIFYIEFGIDFTNAINIKVTWNGKLYPIRRVLPHQPLGNDFLCLMLVQG